MQESITAEMEAEVLGAVMANPGAYGTAFIEGLDPEKFSGWRYTLAVALNEMIGDGLAADPTAVVEYLRTHGRAAKCSAVQVFDAYQSGGRVLDPNGSIIRLGRLFLARDVNVAGMQIQQMAQQDDVANTIAYMEAEAARFRKIEAGRVGVEVPGLYEFLNAGTTEIDWAIPGILPAATSLMITAEEGLGKSVLLRQIAVAATMGLDPFTPGDRQARYKPKRALIIDCEVSQNQLRRSLTKVWGHATRYEDNHPAFGGMLGVISVQAGLDLSRPEDQGLLHGWVRAHRPEILVIGPVYRMSATDVNEEQGVRAWQRPLEAIMAEGTSVVLEHHAPNEGANKRALRPIGSSAIRRWSAQGVSLRAVLCKSHDLPWCPTCGRSARVELWRGSRDETDWPTHLRSAADSVWWERDEYAEVMAS
jgi:replicative DNA helicase